MRICILGDSGLLGQSLTEFLLLTRGEVLGISSGSFPGNPYRALNSLKYHHKAIDVLKAPKNFCSALKEFNPELLVNCAALTDLSRCEREVALAQALNEGLPGFLAELASTRGIRFIQISTDQVFDGQKDTPYTENDTPRPLTVYGSTKWMGEINAMKRNPDALVLRTNIVGFRDRKDQPTFAEWLGTALYHQEPILLAEDFITSSVHVDALSKWILKAHALGLRGVFHFATRDWASKFDFGKLFAQQAGLDFSSVRKGRLADLKLRPERPPCLALAVAKGENSMEILFERVADTTRRLAADFRTRRKEVARA